MSSVHCPMLKKIRPMSDCTACVNHVKAGTSIEWCRYLIANQNIKKDNTLNEKHRPDNQIRSLYAQINYKRKVAEKFYKTGKPRIAEQVEYEIMTLRKEIKQHEIKAKTFNQKKETVL